jgi:sensor histidine kinase regulating citrate/malate metabolism
MRSIRGRLILSHIIPLLVVSPLIGLTIYYLLQTQHELTSLSGELTQQAQAVAQLARAQPDIFTDMEQAQLFVEVFPTENPDFPEVRITILQPGGRPLASSIQPQTSEGTSIFQLPDANVVLAEREGYLRLQAELANVIVPIVDAEDELLGLISLTTELDSVTARMPLVRNLLLGALVLELLLAMILGLFLAWYFERDLRAVTTAVANISFGQTLDLLPERGPSEFRELFRAYNMTVDPRISAPSIARQPRA